MTEAQLERKVVEFCREYKLLTYKFSSPAHRGVPDRIILYHGRALFLELKRLGKKPTKLQERELAELRASGCAAHWTDNFETARNLILKFAVSV
jgi:hypothetical protein